MFFAESKEKWKNQNDGDADNRLNQKEIMAIWGQHRGKSMVEDSENTIKNIYVICFVSLRFLMFNP